MFKFCDNGRNNLLYYQALCKSVMSFSSQVEDIIDTGNTLFCLIAHLEAKGASSVSVCAFLDKPSRRKVQFELVGKGKFYRGFEVRCMVVLGYAL